MASPAALAKALREAYPDGSSTTVGRHDVYRFRVVTPAHTFESVVMGVGRDRLVQLTARDSFDESLAAFLLDQVADVPLPGLRATTIRVVNVASPPPRRFTALVIVPPVIAKRFEHESASLRRATYWVVPAFDGEFADRSDGATFWHQLGRKDGWRSVVIRWDRTRKTRPVFDA